MPSKVLNFQTPIYIFKESFPVTRVLNDLTLKIICCTTFAHEHNNIGKPEPRAIKYIFVGYSITQKGYKHFNPKNKKMFVTMGVTFFENFILFYFMIFIFRENRKDDSFQIKNMVLYFLF